MPSDGKSIRLSLAVMKAKWSQKKDTIRKECNKLKAMRKTIKKKEEELDTMEEERSSSFSSGSPLLPSSGSESEKEDDSPADKVEATGSGVPPATGKPPPKGVEECHEGAPTEGARAVAKLAESIHASELTAGQQARFGKTERSSLAFYPRTMVAFSMCTWFADDACVACSADIGRRQRVERANNFNAEVGSMEEASEKNAKSAVDALLKLEQVGLAGVPCSVTGADERHVDVCLVDVLRAYGYKCGYQADGPFWAMHDGNNFLAAYGKTVARATWSRLCTAADGQFILTMGNHFIALRKKDGCLEVNHGHRSHEWQSACRWQTGVPIGFSEDLGQRLIDPAACSGLFCIEERDTDASLDAGADLAGGGLGSIPVHLIKDFVRNLGDLRSVAYFERACRETRDLVTAPDVWADRHAGILPAELSKRTGLGTVRGSTIRKWESRQPALGPVHFQLSGTDSVQRLVISVGSSDPAGDRCWCEIKAPFDDTVVIELGHNRLGRPNDVCVAVLPALRPERLLQAQWWNKRLQVFLDGHRIGMLSLQDCDVQQWAKDQQLLHANRDGDRITYWRSQKQTCGSVSLEISLPSEARFLVVALRRAPHISTPDNSTCVVWRKPLAADGGLAFRLSDGKRVTAPVPKDMTLERNSAHTYHFEWKTDFLNFSLDKKCIATVPLTWEQNLDRWVRPAAMRIAPPSSSARDFQVTYLPFRYSADFGHPTCAYCHAESVACCQDCEHWFCEQHGLADNGVATFFAIDRNAMRIPGSFGLVDVELDAVLPPPLRERRFPRSIVLEPPSSFDTTHLGGMSVLDVLSRANLHPRDRNLQFQDTDHIYTWEGRRVSVSVTSLIHGLTHQFSPADALRAMRNGRNWPREEYTVANVVEVINQHLLDDHSTLTLRQLVDAQVTDIGAICRSIRDLVWTHPGCSYLASAVSMTDAEILDKWERNRRTAAAQIRAHGCMSDACMLRVFVERWDGAEGWMIFRTEWCVYGEAEDVAGSIDAVAIRQDEYCILDWERTKALASKDAAYGRMMHFPLNNVPDSVLWHYRVQVNIYAWILRKYYDINVTELRIVCLHPDNAPQPLIVNVPMMQDKIEKLMSWRRDDIHSQIHLSADARDLRGGSQEDGPSFMTWRRNDLQSRIGLTGSQGSSDLTMLSDLRAGTQDKEGFRLPQMHADDLQQLRDDSVVESMMSTEWNRMHGLVDPAVRSMHLHGLHARTQMCEFLTSVNDLRGGSQDDGDSFSQMLEQQLEEALEGEEPVPKRHKALASTNFSDMSATMTQYMQTDFDMESIPGRLHDMDTSEVSILQEVANIQRVVANYEASAAWSTSFRFLVQGALAIHRLRLLDISRREEVMFLELIEGFGRHVRAHNGQCFFYSEHGHWNVYKGVIPEGTLARCKKFLLQLEGLYALFGHNVLRDNDGILEAARELLERHSNRPDILFAACEEAAICRLPVKNNAGSRGEEDDREERANGSMHWTLAMANTIGKLYVKLHLAAVNDIESCLCIIHEADTHEST
ncbi:unnamed protein product [Symbiodinium microadriaticum]|nr:GIP [Symbiodinium sp. KB8]CAE7229749.1 unnamed protein product [Symbiodinium microadriaticum]